MEEFELQIKHESIVSDTMEENDMKVKQFMEKEARGKITVTTKILTIVTVIQEKTT